MLDEKKLEEIRKKIPKMLQEGDISKKEDNKKLVNFYEENALTSLNAARIIYSVSESLELKKNFQYISGSFEAYLWVINPSYYSMFYMASALLAKEGIKVRSEVGVHKKTFEAFVYYFYLTNRLPKYFFEIFEEAQRESLELLGKDKVMTSMQQMTIELMKNYDYEMNKRSTFTYQIGEKAKQNKANTSLKRALEFYQELKKVLELLR